jgi:hypothetical protein
MVSTDFSKTLVELDVVSKDVIAIPFEWIVVVPERVSKNKSIFRILKTMELVE